MRRIFILEDDPLLGEILEEHLQKRFEVTLLQEGLAAEECLLKERFDLWLLDIQVPGLNGLELLKNLRTLGFKTPAIFITSQNSSKDLKAGFEAGAHDYIRKPFDLDELDARIQNLSNLFGLSEEEEVAPGITFLANRNLLILQGKSFSLRKKEAEIFSLFLQNRGKTLTPAEIIANVWRYEETPTPSTLRSHIKSLRKLLGDELIQNIRGLGYRFG